jgi:hypothetical protein
MDSITIKVIKTNGTYDDAATEAAFRTQYAALKAANLACTEEVALAIHEVFDSLKPGERVNLPHLVSKAIGMLDVPTSEYGTWVERVGAYVRDNSKGEDPLFNIGKGTKSGGVARLRKPEVVTISVDELMEDAAQ